ncbi:MAG: right-handed parallel beta-helix repeat-containing protein [Acidobacteria bacterium]|nr:right-handed parallel beta-helix repeat-containing protein [Acidobacteriota bacterium]
MLRTILAAVALCAAAWGQWADPAAVQEVAAGKRTTANAAWWGFKEDDATEALQAAIDSGAKKVVVPMVGAPWIIRPVRLRGSQELVFEPGVLVLAKKGEFKGGGDSLFTASGVSDLVIRGYGATLRMRKLDYQGPDYKKAEWRMGVSILGCRRVRVEGLRVESSGGDGFYVAGGANLHYSEDIVIRDVVAHDNHRQGMSVISAVNLLVENSVFSGTWGTAPEAGIDFEPDVETDRLVNCVVRNCRFISNRGHAILVYLKPLTKASAPVSVRFENCHSRMGEPGMDPAAVAALNLGGHAGMVVGAAGDKGPQGLVEFIDSTSENTGREGAKVYDKSAAGVRVRFVRCAWKSPWTSPAPEYWGQRVPVLLEARRAEVSSDPGGVDFEDCRVYDAVNRPAVVYDDARGVKPLRDVHGRITVAKKTSARFKGAGQTDLQVISAEK